MSDLRARTLPAHLHAGWIAVTGGVLLTIAVGLSLAADNGVAHFWHAYLVAVTFCLTISLGGLFFVMLHHLTQAGWSVAVRRVAELLAAALPLLAFLFAPLLAALLLGDARLYVWNDAALLAEDEVVRGKAAYLNAPFFIARTVAYFMVWWLLTRQFVGGSLNQDRRPTTATTLRMQRFSGPAMMAFAVTVCFAGFDWLMSLDPHWYSTIYGVYFFSGAVVGFLAALSLLVIALEKAGPLRGVITTKHIHDLGKLLFGFTFFWAYIAFSQYLLIWYANIPEETSWYLVRQNGGWQWVTVFLFAGHFALPFLGLMSRRAKHSRATLAFWAGWLLVMHWIDLYWLVMPGFSPMRIPLCWIDLLSTLGLLLIFVAIIARLARGRPLVPVADPRLHESL